jgi:hypothetical protein
MGSSEGAEMKGGCERVKGAGRMTSDEDVEVVVMREGR